MPTCLLVVVDGLRPEALDAAPMPTLQALRDGGAYYATAQSLMPNCTLPCHFSIFHSVPPERHGITTNWWTPPVRPVPGIFEAVHGAGKRNAFAHNWDELRDLGRPGNVQASYYVHYEQPGADLKVTESALGYLGEGYDFIFCYLGYTDAQGHITGWLSPEYLRVAAIADGCIARLLAALPPDAAMVVTSDHGGHDRTHGTDCPEDMTVPLLIHAPGRNAAQVEAPTLLDIAPTIATLCGIGQPAEWEGRSLVQ